MSTSVGLVDSVDNVVSTALPSAPIAKKPPEKTQSVKLRFHAKTDALKSWILDSVDAVSLISVHVSRFANMYLLHCFSNSLPIPMVDNVFYNHVMYLVTDTQRKKFSDKQMQAAYESLYQRYLRDATLSRTTDHYRFLERLTLDMETNARVYLKTQFITRFRQWCRDFVVSAVPLAKDAEQLDEKKTQRWKLVNYLFQETAKSTSCVDDVAKLQTEANNSLADDCKLVWNDEISLKMAEAIAETRRDLNTEIDSKKGKVFCRPITGSKLLRTDLNYCYLRWMHKRLVELEAHNANPKNKQKKVYSMLPIRSLDRSYISISKTALLEWINRNRSDETAVGHEIFAKTAGMEKDEFAECFNANQLWFWQQCFEFDNALSGCKRFKGPIVTDGYACSVVTKGRIAEEDDVQESERDAAVVTLQDDERARDKKIKVFSQEELDSADVVGVDPGRKTLYTSAFDTESEKHAIATYSVGKWRHVSGGNEAQRKRKQWAENASAEYNKWLLGMPSTKVATVDGMHTHMRHLMLRLDECFCLNGKMRVRKLRFCNYVFKQKALASMVNEFITQTKESGSQKQKLIVAFGDASFKTSGPVRKMKVELRRRQDVTVVAIDEFHTSLMMTCCAFASEAKAVERKGPLVKTKDSDGNECCSQLYGVSYCKNCTCYWNRDVNAAINMLRVFQHAQQNCGARHEFFSRKVASSAKQKRTAAKRQGRQGGVAKKSKTIPGNQLGNLLTGRTSSCAPHCSLEE